ncbi:MAG: ribosome small subunit-dependent GTPase A [Planctomycetaceae bacterium]|nr:ribosome small subunit-dependent GTPase A [Planctomycetaceae bacterium]
MAKKKSPRKVRVPFRKNREKRVRSQNLTFESQDPTRPEPDAGSERISGKGRLTRYRTIIGVDGEGNELQRELDESVCDAGRVLRAIGSTRCDVQSPSGRAYVCTVRRVLRTMLRDARNAVVAGDRVMFRITGPEEGVIERVQPRQTVFSRGVGQFEHVIAANIDQLVIVASVSAPPLKPALIDRFLVSAAKGGVRPIICLNKADLVEPAEIQPFIELYQGLGYEILATSATTGVGIDRLREQLCGKETVVGGQSGVGKSSLLNAVQPGMSLRTGQVSDDSGKGRHTTRVAELLPLQGGGWIVDTPGVRQMELWDVAREEIEAYFIEFPPFVANCRFPDCTHTHETGCQIKAAVEQGRISPLRYASYQRMFLGD